MVQLMDKIAGTVLAMNGWCSVDKAQALAALVVGLKKAGRLITLSSGGSPRSTLHRGQ
jgi:hypothetical protein